MLDPTDLALTMAKQIVLGLDKQDRTPERLREIAKQASEMLNASVGPVSVDTVARHLESEFEVWVPQAIVVSDPGDHEPWLDKRRRDIEFAYWSRYSTLLQKGWKSSAVEALDQTTDQILDLMENPNRSGSWKTYGMVYGQVQSGKTANYTGLICKAVDAGYQVVVVLTSQHESLRHQTQERLDREFLGFNTKFTRDPDAESSKKIGVGALGLKSPAATCQAVTTRDSDFTAAQFQGSAVNVPETRILVVAKKNARILNNLKAWLGNFAELQSDGSRLIINTPLLLIDDEADYASVDTKRPTNGRTQSDPDHDPTAINKAIRGLLELFEKRVYLAYTATPFANIFISNSTNHPELGEDLFPRSFMVALEPPSNYCGPEVVFGLEDPAAAEIREPLPIIREVDDYNVWLPDAHPKSFKPQVPLPSSLVEALDAFVLSTAVRRVRGRDHDTAGGHSTMLVHVTRYTEVQAAVARQIEQHLQEMADSWGDYGQSGVATRERLKNLWETDFTPTYSTLASRDDVSAMVGPPVSWASVQQAIPQVLEDAAAGVRRINGSAADVLDYQSTTPITVVAVGGDKLSRGLTLEGLSVSYYLRASRMYDTLLQMGRWFGYRPGYLDATRLYTTQDLVSYYVHITRANRELMDLTSAVAKAGDKPKHVGMRVLDGVGNLRVTAAAKMRSTASMSVSFSATRAETLVIRTDKRALTRNNARLEELLEQISSMPAVPDQQVNGAGRGFFRQSVPAQVVLNFLEGFDVSPRVLTANPENLVAYIRAQMSKDELLRWTVAVTAGSSATRLTSHSVDIPLVQRKPISSRVRDGEFEVGVLVSPAHEELGLSPDTVQRALERTAEEFKKSGKGKAPARASGESLRMLRDPTEGLLLIYPIDPVASGVEVPKEGIPAIGYAVVFPHSTQAEKVRYRVNEVFLEGLLKAVEEDEDEEQ
ncbi:Z1 domain-containing protein [Planotetraspora phitsanulokensis]|uniref:Endonuclease n=1 Tax=Planotetraspora phitsanulokensis TaxID=575192 RepID=A0A8J3U6U2_9ACTN|nr:Z1 domain-containing protein [Planotetraspora phitsanulokensis]GII37049.1 endonuclease [Planotetraspora phitsanulokensis]